MERKEFLKKIIVNGSIVAMLPTLVIQSCEKDEPMDDPTNGSNGTNSDITIDLNKASNAALKETDGFINLQENNIIVINKGNNEYVALSNVCTHQGCKVGYTPSQSILPCPCHGSVFDINGSVLNGPANSPLREYKLSLSDNIITIKK